MTSDRTDETRLWRQVVNALPDGVMLVDERGKALAVNQALEGIAERAEVHGASCCELFGCHHPSIATPRHASRAIVCRPTCIQYLIGVVSR